LNKIIQKVNWNLEKTNLLSISFNEWPDMSIGENTVDAKLQVIVKGIVISLSHNSKEYELKLLYNADVKYVNLVELLSGKVILNSGLDI
jgi:hypothetical protein